MTQAAMPVISPRFGKKQFAVWPSGRREVVRIASYLSILLIDLAAIKAAFSIAGMLRGEYRLQADNIQIQWIMMLIYVVVAASSEAIDRSAFGSRLISIMKAERALLLSSAITIMILFFARLDLAISRLAMASALAGSAVIVAVGRSIFLTLFLGRRDELWESCLLICDGVPVPPGFPGASIDAEAAQLCPETDTHESVARFGEYATRYDRLVVFCPDPQRRAAWAHLLKSFDIHGELLIEGRDPIGAIGVGRVYGNETLVVTRGTLSLANRVKKRGFDIIAASLALLLLAPLMLAVAIAIRFDSPGPALFRQPRVGFQNRSFRIFKFRSMRVEASDLNGDRSTGKQDDRITRLGRFIRRTSIDELPQLFNVLLGDMSIVGPRPHALGSLAGDELFWKVDGAYWKRHALKPGITGLAQIRGFRGATLTREDLVNRLGADMEYVDGWSIWRDFRIILATARVLVHANAY